MMSAGTSSELPESVNRPEVEPAERERGAERDPEQHDRIRPDQVEHAREHAVDRAAEVAGDGPGERRQDDRDQRRDAPISSELRPP